ncbi:MAG: RecQ family ATP-dependent DNA helicase, partial [Planctomycetales bacterium]|nr:RecQ family ATP-dependent DNA helicase [Planctomycetales bacterium]
MSETAPQDASEFLPRLGLRDFRPGQRDVIEAVLANEDCLCIMPTGGGKSLCFQLPAVMRPGLVLVISPLIALMKDQVDGLQRAGQRATFVNSSLSPAEQADRAARMQQGEYDLVYVAPERFRSPRFVDALKRSHVQLLAVDEAHCISQWGHDFRPDYARLGWFRRQLNAPTIALTATATPAVRDDVVKQLGLPSPRVFMAGFARPNLR